jgi:uncharacterized protein
MVEVRDQTFGEPDAVNVVFDFPSFKTRAPWWGADLQTLRNVLVGSAARPDVEATNRLSLPLSDETGDALSAVLTAACDGNCDNPLVVLIHGLSGSEASSYMLMSTRFWSVRSFPVLRLNLRGAGPSRETCSQQYHAGRTRDLRDALNGISREFTRNGFILIGYSLGGNMLLKFMAEFAQGFPIVAAASVSAPIDLAAASRRFLARRNWVYHQHLLCNMKRECFGGPVAVSNAEREVILACRSILEFDERIVAPRNGFRDATHYYHENHARRFLANIAKPTLLIHALNDPWIPADAYTSYAFGDNTNLHPVLTPSGGHVGFHSGGSPEPYYDRCILSFVSSILA